MPPPPIADGGVSVDGISLNGHAGNTLIVAPGADVKITGTATDKNVGCPGCVMFADVAFRGAGAAKGCLGTSMIQPGSASATTTGTVDLGNAPTALGFYDIVLEGQAQFNCGDGWTANGGTTIAQIWVQPPDFNVGAPPIADGGVSVDSISLNGHAGNTLSVAPGADVQIKGTATDKNVGCPNCIMFADVAFRGAGAAKGCFGGAMRLNAPGPTTATGTVDLGNAPTTAGFYDIVLEGQAQFNCGDGWTANGGTTTAQIRVVAPPVCPAVTSSTAYATPVTITLACTGTTLAYTVAAGGGPAHGTLGAIGGNQVRYTPATGFSGPDTFRLTATDAAGSTATEPVTVNVSPAPTPILQPSGVADRDHDGIADTADRCPTVPRGAFDGNNDGCPGPYRRISAKLIGTWVVGDRGVRIGSMTFGPVPVGTKIRVSCGACSARQTVTAKRRTVSLTKVRGTLLKRGASVTATATKPGFIGQQITLTVVHYGHRLADFEHAAAKPFNRRTRCIPAGATRPAKTCSATPPTGP